MSQWRRLTIQLNNEVEKKPVPIVWDAGVATGDVGDGRFIPVLIIDTTDRPDIEDMVRAHKHLGPGDADSVWSRPSRLVSNKIQLILSFTKPTRCVLSLEFDLERLGGILDQIIHAEGVYLQPGRPGDRLVTNLDKERVLVEVPSKQFRGEWENIYLKSLKKRFRKGGLSRSQAKQATRDFVIEWRKVGSIRVPNS
ncbi:MAG TPA: hypothetical protein VEQ38_23790 [Verrucomicrobiae bacterium]|nr:hypothetical protein [Verrucomicrobiae bacterium]